MVKNILAIAASFQIWAVAIQAQANNRTLTIHRLLSSIKVKNESIKIYHFAS
jgi:hypothetical protein